MPGVVDLLVQLQQAGYLLIVVTNQSGIARGYFDEPFVEKTHTFLADELATYGIKIAAFYYCPHHPSLATRPELMQHCSCRKPAPGMLVQAAQEFDLDLTASLMIGDSPADFEAGSAAGCKVYHINDALAGAINTI